MTQSWDSGSGPVVVIGAGLIGASIGCALTGAGVLVHLEDRVRSHALVAAGRGAGRVDPAPAAEVVLVVVAVPPDAIAATVDAALGRFPEAVVTDVGSVKGQILSRLVANGTPMQRYVGSHPMAGSQHTGPLTASPDLFEDRTWVITPSVDAAPWAVARVRRLAELCRSRVVVMPAQDHDRAVAQVSHLPQLMSSLTAGHLRGVPAANLRLAGQGIRDVTRIAGSDPRLWRQIITANLPAVKAELAGVRADLDHLMAALDDPDAVESFFEQGRTGVRALPGKHGTDRRDWESVVIEIPDAPGALAGLFADIQAIGINVEDLSIEHDQTRTVGYLSVEVEAEAADRLRTAASDRGWTLRD